MRTVEIRAIARVISPLAVILCLFGVTACSAPAASAPTSVPAKQAAPAPATTEKYPTRPIDFIVPWGAGGGADQMARKLSPLAEKELGVPLPVINVAGAAGSTGTVKMLAAPADGYAFEAYMADQVATVAFGQAPFTHKDFAPIARIMQQFSSFFVRTDGPYKSWKDVETAAKANPGKIRVAITGAGSVDELLVLFFEKKGVKMTGVPFPQPGERYTSLLGGHADVLIEQCGDITQYLTGGQFKPVIMFSEERAAAFPDCPSSKELGYDIYLPQWRSIVAKAGTDPTRIKMIGDALNKACSTQVWKDYLKGNLLG